MVRCAAAFALSEQQRRQFSATAERTERQNAPQTRRRSCSDVNFRSFCESATASAVSPFPLTHRGLLPNLSTSRLGRRDRAIPQERFRLAVPPRLTPDRCLSAYSTARPSGTAPQKTNGSQRVAACAQVQQKSHLCADYCLTRASGASQPTPTKGAQ